MANVISISYVPSGWQFSKRQVPLADLLVDAGIIVVGAEDAVASILARLAAAVGLIAIPLADLLADAGIIAVGAEGAVCTLRCIPPGDTATLSKRRGRCSCWALHILIDTISAVITCNSGAGAGFRPCTTPRPFPGAEIEAAKPVSAAVVQTADLIRPSNRSFGSNITVVFLAIPVVGIGI